MVVSVFLRINLGEFEQTKLSVGKQKNNSLDFAMSKLRIQCPGKVDEGTAAMPADRDQDHEWRRWDFGLWLSKQRFIWLLVCLF